MPHHILCNRHIMVDLPVVNLKFQAYEIRQDGGGASLCFDWGDLFASFRADDGEAVVIEDRLY